MRKFENIDLYQMVKELYSNAEILLSNWHCADYMTENGAYIILIPFIDTEKLYRLNIFYQNNRNTDRKIEIITLKENREKIDEILTKKTNIIEMDNWLGGIDEEREKG